MSIVKVYAYESHDVLWTCRSLFQFVGQKHIYLLTMDIKKETDIKDELFVSTDDDGMSSYHCEHVSRGEESLVDRSCDYPSINVKSEIDVKDEPLDVEEEEDPMNDQLFEFVSVKEENQKNGWVVTYPMYNTVENK
ncbi:hypothetical protein Anas_11501 [Armadillidium nasatum]|uniref:Uncharacterized protein n=1 Tax=Armadillidium nasatum TaxID=96803 RepID=A0A5N5T9T5_9CRUS|nr:hypothetical protein Anas_11501 [Armadillidium nasatum]